MPKIASSKAKAAAAAASGPPALYGEDLSGPPLVVDLTVLSAWTATPDADASRKEECLTGGARWGHAAMLSPSESVLCVVGGTPCHRPNTAGHASAPLWEYTPVTPATNTSATKTPSVATLHSARVWKAGGARQAVPQDVMCGSNSGPAKSDDWPLFASWWALWPFNNGASGPSVMYADGGWSDAHRVAGVRAFADSATGDISFTPPPSSVATTSSTRSHHSVTYVQGRFLRFGGETQQGIVAALEEVDSASGGSLHEKQDAGGDHRCTQGRETAVPEPASTLPTLPSSLGPPPPRAAHGACSLGQRYIVVVGGRHVQTQVDDASAVAGGASPGKGARAKRTTAMRALSPGRRAGASRKDGKGSPASLEASAPASATLTTLKDVAVYDAKLGVWLPVRVVGGGAVPCARYAAAVAAVPMPGAALPTSRHRSPAADAVQREVLVVGGLDAEGAVCADAWVMQVLSGTDAELAEVPAGTPADSASAAVPVVKVRWVRLELPRASASVFQRHHAAVVVSSQRVVYLVGGCGPHDAAEPPVCTLELPPLTSASLRVADETGGAAEGAVPKRPSTGTKGLAA